MQQTFTFSSALWTNKEPYNEADGLTGLDKKETKLPSYWTTPFTKICLGMKVGSVTNFVMINTAAPSLHSLIADGAYRNVTHLGRDAWKSLLPDPSLQVHCNVEGFNVQEPSASFWPVARIGIVGNNEENCDSPDSRIGFGTAGHPRAAITCGIAAGYGADNGDRYVEAMGYIFIF